MKKVDGDININFDFFMRNLLNLAYTNKTHFSNTDFNRRW